MPRDYDDYTMQTVQLENGKWRAHATLWEEDICMYAVLKNFNHKWWNGGNSGEVPLEIITMKDAREEWMPYHQDRFVEHMLEHAKIHCLSVDSFDPTEGGRKPLWDNSVEEYYKYLCGITANVT